MWPDFGIIGAAMGELLEDRGYTALLGAFGPALLDPTGSRPSAIRYVRSTLSPRSSVISRFFLLTTTRSARKTPHRIT